MVSSPLSFAQLELLWEEAGGPQAVAPIAAAIALAESSGNPFEIVSDPTQHDPNAKANGLWQINTGSDANPQYGSWNLTDPMTNAIAAVQIWKSWGGSFDAWTTYTSGAWLSHLPSGFNVQQLAALAPSGGSVIAPVQISDNVRKIGIIVMGVILIVIGSSVFRSGQS